MIYNYDSIWVHLYVTYVLQIQKKKFTDLPILEAFRRSTNSEQCPISNCYTKEQFTCMMTESSFKGNLKGCYISLWELHLTEVTENALSHKDLRCEHIDFLKSLIYTDSEIPTYQVNEAGIGGCYSFTK